MSGSGGGGYVPPQRTKFDCETSIIVSTVSSINLTILEKHNVGQILFLMIGENEELLIEDGDGEILGAILHSNTSDIINCMKQGATYQAEITTINSPTCKVKISRN
ncbi:hypothetical protein [Maribacter litoralis]|uniref:hypothetical protein n=1 Tax=Maribacter litoralis TaxID=2059726 RepID=UPI000E319A96|nr:hypothetical protein [Maribacter litoralis]